MKKIPLILLIIAFSSILYATSAKAVDVNKLISRFNLESKINQRRETIENSINSLSTDLTDGVNAVKTEVHSQISKYKDLIGISEQIADIVTQNNSSTTGEVAQSRWYQLATREQTRDVLGVGGQTETEQQNTLASKALEQSKQVAVSAQGDNITQNVMKRIASQNTQNTTVLQLIQSTIQEQKQLTATGNVLLGDISTQLTNQKHQQLQQQEAIRSVISANSGYRTKLRGNGIPR